MKTTIHFNESYNTYLSIIQWDSMKTECYFLVHEDYSSTPNLEDAAMHYSRPPWPRLRAWSTAVNRSVALRQSAEEDLDSRGKRREE
jgi:hypothetical protein